ncbi:MAG TPA: aspartate/glutamate racemase family protein [Burkholderiaceae bacterium]|nr:aspartate/glutamate racemase family protein [Burkholderiaceae bacterium]
MTRIALIHALADSVAPINAALARDWPEAQRMNLLDDSLSGDLARRGSLDAAMFQRFERLADYAFDAGSDAILFTCSAFGPCIEAAARKHPARPVLKPNEAMVREAAASGARVGLVASFAPTLASMPQEFAPGVELRTALAEGALAALQAGQSERHDELAAQAAARLAAAGCRLIALAQFSLARAAPLVAERTGLPVLTTVDSAVRALRRRLEAR